MKKLVIVESPNKKRLIQKYLGDEYIVEASVGHIRDLSMDGKYNLGIDIDSGKYEPTYSILPGKEKVADKLIKMAKESSDVYLASDPDREGEAISWHLCSILGIDPLKANRLEFHEITKHAILNAVDNVRNINMDLFHAQEARRILDRIIGFRTSFITKRDIHSPSAGRVQSVVLRFLNERNEEIKNFIPTPYFYLNSKVDSIVLNYSSNGQRVKFEDENEVKKINDSLGKEQKLIDIKKEIKETKSFPPYTLSALQQACSILYKYKVSVTLKCAKDLFEHGFITYPRTDSVRLAPEFINKTKAYIKENYGDEYVGVAKIQGSKGSSQDAHEALRPTDLAITVNDIKAKFKTNPDCKKICNVYEQIFNQTVKSIMTPRKDEITTYVFDNNGNEFICTDSNNIFKGFSIVDKEKKEKKQKYDFEVGKSYKCKNEIEKLLTEAPKPYTEGGLVKKMEETGIGRPSTYASTIQTIISAGYATSRTFIEITTQGEKTSNFLLKHFPKTFNTEYTANLESKLDDIANGKEDKNKIIKKCDIEFLEEFEPIKDNPDCVGPEYTGENCPNCGSPLVKITYGSKTFIGCSNYPKCKYIKPEYTGKMCPECGKPLVYKVSKSGKFIACSGYPECKHTEFIKKPFFKKKEK